jgi:hypothetical protein
MDTSRALCLKTGNKAALDTRALEDCYRVSREIPEHACIGTVQKQVCLQLVAIRLQSELTCFNKLVYSIYGFGARFRA